MNRLGIQSLNAGAPDLRLSGDQTQRGSYVQRRRAQMAGGGIMGSNAGSMLVAPTADGSRPGYGWLDTIVDVAKKVGQTIVPGGETGYIDLYGGQPTLPTGMPQGSPGQINPYTPPTFPTSPNFIQDIFGGAPTEIKEDPWYKKLGQVFGIGETQASERTGITNAEKAAQVLAQGFPGPGLDNPQYYPPREEDVPWYIKLGQTIMPGGEPGFLDLYSGGGGGGGANGDPSIFRQAANIGVPLGIGKWAHDYQKDWLAKQPPFPGDETSIRFQTAQEAMADPTLRFKPEAQYANVAEGGRIGYREGEGVESLPVDQMQDIEGQQAGGEYNRAMELMLKVRENIPLTDEEKEELRGLMQTLLLAKGGRVAAQEGGLMDLGGMEKDYRQEGGFVPIGGKEKADDVPARLSKNEFVFTADAVRAAGGGDIDAGAEVMENVMKNLEAGGEVSEESQGLEGARDMFANAQQLEKRII